MPDLRRRAFLHLALAPLAGTLLGCAPEPRAAIPPGPAGTSPPRPTVADPVPTASAVAAPAPAIVTADAARPQIPYGVQSGDVTADAARIWSRTDRPARMIVEWSTREDLASPTRLEGPAATPEADFTARVDLVGLPPGARIFYRVTFADLDSGRTRSEPALGSLVTAPESKGDVSFVWSGDTAGQGWGINLAWGGMKIYEAMRRVGPDFFLHCGDMIYADNPILPEVTLPDGSIWTNLVTPEKSHVAETLADFRGNFAYNLLDQHVRRFNAEVPSYLMWDDHEVHDNWWPTEVLEGDRRYTERRLDVLAARAKQAMLEYTPIRPGGDGGVYRSFRRGPLLEVIVLDERTHRGPNGDDRQAAAGPAAAFLGPAQVRWLKQVLERSTATWKVIGTDMPLSLVVADRPRGGALRFDAWAAGSAPALGRELELADILRFIKARRIQNVVWLTADVHYAAAHHYAPSRAKMADFTPFWEFVAGPLHASTYGPNRLDPTFGPELRYRSPAAGRLLRGPADGGQYFGAVRIDGRSAAMTVRLHDLAGTKLYEVELPPA